MLNNIQNNIEQNQNYEQFQVSNSERNMINYQQPEDIGNFSWASNDTRIQPLMIGDDSGCRVQDLQNYHHGPHHHNKHHHRRHRHHHHRKHRGSDCYNDGEYDAECWSLFLQEEEKGIR
eukprot:UN03338